MRFCLGIKCNKSGTNVDRKIALRSLISIKMYKYQKWLKNLLKLSVKLLTDQFISKSKMKISFPKKPNSIIALHCQ